MPKHKAISFHTCSFISVTSEGLGCSVCSLFPQQTQPRRLVPRAATEPQLPSPFPFSMPPVDPTDHPPPPVPSPHLPLCSSPQFRCPHPPTPHPRSTTGHTCRKTKQAARCAARRPSLLSLLPQTQSSQAPPSCTSPHPCLLWIPQTILS